MNDLQLVEFLVLCFFFYFYLLFNFFFFFFFVRVDFLCYYWSVLNL